MQTPLFCEEGWLVVFLVREFHLLPKAGDLDFLVADCLPCLTNWLIVGMCFSSLFIHTIPGVSIIGVNKEGKSPLFTSG